MAKASAAKRYRRLACEAIQEEEISTAPWIEAKVQVTFCYKDNRIRDQDNAIASLKAAYDGIVDSGLLPNDDYQHMKREMPVFTIDKYHPCVILVITRTK